MPASDLRYHFAALIAMLIWGSSFVALKLTVNIMPPVTVVFLRMLVGACAFLLLWPWLKKGVHYQAGDAKYLLAMAAFEPCLYFLFEAAALQYTSAGQAGMVTSMLPLMVAIAAFIFLKENVQYRQWAGFMVAVAGVVWMTLTGSDFAQAPHPLLGNSLEFLAMVAAVGYTLLVKHLAQRYSPLFLTAIQSYVGTVFFFPFALYAPWPEALDMSTIWLIVYLGLVVSLGAYGLYNYALSRLDATTVAGYTNLLPAFALMFSMWWLSEKVAFAQWLAIAVVFAGVALSQVGMRSLKKTVPATG